MTRLIIAVILIMMTLPAHAAEHAITGTWKIASFVREVIATGERQNEFGDKPEGYISYQADGRMFAMLVGSNRARPAGSTPTDEEKVRLFGTLIAYSGAYLVEGDKITHKIDVSWNQNWTGGDQVRFFKVDGDTLTITTATNKSPRDGREGRAIVVFTRAR
jgi:hypothetical protein